MDSELDDEPEFDRREEARPCPSGPPVDHYQPSGHRYTKKELTDRLAYAQAKAWSVTRKRQMCPLPLPAATERRIRQWFELVDGDGSGQLNTGDLEFALKAAGIPANPNTVAEIIKLFDFDQDGEIAWREFHHILSYEVMADKDPLGSDYVLPSGMSLPLGSMIETIRRRKILDDVQKGGVHRDFWAAEGPDFLRCLLQSESYNFDEKSREILRRILSYKPPKDADAGLSPEAVEENKRRIERLKLALLQNTGGGAATGGSGGKHGGSSGGSHSGPRQGIGRSKAGQQQQQSAAATAAAFGTSPWSSPAAAAAAAALAEGSTSTSRRSLDAVTTPISRATRLLRTQHPLRRETVDGGAQPSLSLWSTLSLWEADSAAATAAAAVDGRSNSYDAAARSAGAFSGFSGGGAYDRGAGAMKGGPLSPPAARWAAGGRSSNPGASDRHGPASAHEAAGAGVWSATASRLPRTPASATSLTALGPGRQAAAAHDPRGGAPGSYQHQHQSQRQGPLSPAAAGSGGGGGDVRTAATGGPLEQPRLSTFGAPPPPVASPAPSTAAAAGGGGAAADAAADGDDPKLTVPDAYSFSGMIKDMRHGGDAEALFSSAAVPPPPLPLPGDAVPRHGAPSLPLKRIQRCLSTGRSRPFSNSLVKAARGGRPAHAASPGPSGGGSSATGGGGDGGTAASQEGSYIAGLDDRFSFEASPRAAATAPGPAAVAAVAPVERSAMSASASLGSGGGSKAAGGGGPLSLQQFASALLQRGDAAAGPAHPYMHPHPPPSPTMMPRPLMANGRAEAVAAAAEIRRSVWDATHHRQHPHQQQPRGGWPAAPPPAMPGPRLLSYGAQGTTSLAAHMLLSSSMDCAGGAGLLARHGLTHTGECPSGLERPDPQQHQQQHALAQLGGPYAHGSVPQAAAGAAGAPAAADAAFPPWTAAAAAPGAAAAAAAAAAARAADVQRAVGSIGQKGDAALRSTLSATAAAPFPAGPARPLVPTPSSPQPLRHDATWTAAAAQLSYGGDKPCAAATATVSAAEGGRFVPMGGRRSVDVDARPGTFRAGSTASAASATSPRGATASMAGRGKRQSSQGQGLGPAARSQHAPSSLGRPSVGVSPPASPVQLMPQISQALPSPPRSPALKEAQAAGGVSATGECPALSPQQLHQEWQQQLHQHQQRRPQPPSGGDDRGSPSCVGLAGDGEAVAGLVGKGLRADAQQQQQQQQQQPYGAVGGRPSTGLRGAAGAAGGGVPFVAGGADRKQDGARRATEASAAGRHWPWPWRKDMVAADVQGAATGGGTQEGPAAKPQPQASRFRSSFLHWS